MSLLDAHNSGVREQRGYDGVTEGIGDLSAAYCRERFAFTDSAAALAAATPADTLVSVGISPTGEPHVGTLGQLESAIAFQEAGFDVQVILADQVVYNARGGSLSALTDLAERYAAFLRERGFDPEEGELVIQSESFGVLSTAFRLAPEYDPGADGPAAEHEPTAFEEALAAAYEDVELPDGASAFSEQLCGLLLAADTVGPLQSGEYERVVLALGADNVGFGRSIDALRAKAGVEGSVVGLYSHLVPGVDGTPKMSKSIPESSLHLGMAPDDLRKRVRDPALDAADPAESVVYGMVRHASPFSGEERAALREARAADDERWSDAVEEYADYLAETAREWQRTGERSTRYRELPP
ncbi:hypothetical protein BRD19_04725 [Halobacteriales archaeon SW_7_65_23]|nr:MAG: hypothetical protein BRD19_04725 [Halobacteriales archaeon SW_7_65_23]